MPIYTPRGLKIRLEPEYAFSLLARLDPRVPPFRVLKTTEGIDLVPSAIALIVGLGCFFAQVDHMDVFKYVLIATLLARVLTLYGVFLIPGMVSVGTAYSYVTGFGVLLVGLSVVGITTVGWKGVVAFFAARFVAGLVGHVLEGWEVNRVYKHTGLALTGSERGFFNAYRLHASQLGITTDISVPDGEIEEGRWRATFLNFAAEYPAVVQRFTTS